MIEEGQKLQKIFVHSIFCIFLFRANIQNNKLIIDTIGIHFDYTLSYLYLHWSVKVCIYIDF